VLIAALAWAGSGCHPILGPSAIDADTNWKVIDSPHFAFYVRPGSYAEQNIGTLIAVLEDQYAFVLSELDMRYAGRVSLFLYTSAADGDEPSERAGTGYPDTEAARAIVSPPLETTFGLLAHESNHVILQNGIGPPATSFMNEGMASAIMSERYHPGGKSFLYPWTARNESRIPPIVDLVDDGKWDDTDSQIAYNAGASFLAYTLDLGGPDRLKQLIPVRSSDFAARFQQLYGKPVEQADREWRAFCATFR
jgi:hypothetical protein